MHSVKIKWVPRDKNGRKTIPPAGEYFAVSKFPEDMDWPNNVWSVVFELDPSCLENGGIVSYGKVRFLVKNAPHERMDTNQGFEIFEGPKKVADVLFLLRN